MSICTSVIAGKGTRSAAIELHKRLQARQGESTLAKRISAVSQHCSCVQLVRYRRHAMLEQERFESIVNNAWSTTLKGQK